MVYAIARMLRTENLESSLAAGFKGDNLVIDLVLIVLLSEEHLLIEDVPGLGKTTLAKALAKSIGGSWSRIQFTPDILPGDITGVSIFNQATNDFEFHFGPIFSNFVLADEINRASPRTQSALLEVMAERTVTVDGVSHKVPRPFLVVATQNPVEMDGTYPLPEAQLDRFMMRVSIGYPSAESEIEILKDEHEGRSIDDIQPVISLEDIAEISKIAKQTYVAPSIFDYITRITNATRVADDVTLGCSPRASLALLKASRVRAMMQGRNHVLPSDIQELAVPICAHRLILKSAHQSTRSSVDDVIRRIVQEVEVPHGEFAE
jgi:MoxR-like ATPase